MERSLDAGQDISPPTAAPRVRRVDLARPWVWLQRGAQDLRRAARPSLGFGTLIAAAGLLLMGAGWKAAYMAPALLGGFLLVAPFAAIVFYALSRQLEQGQAPDAGAALRSWRGNAGSIALFGLMLALAYIAWERIAAIVFALFLEGQTPGPTQWPIELLLAFGVAGALVAVLVFALGVISAPLLLDRPVDAITAMLTSWRCCRLNAGPLLLWAGLLAGLTLLGFASLMLGLLFIFPWLAHASWHAYRDLVEPDEGG